MGPATATRQSAVAIIIPVHNGLAHTRRCIEQLAHQRGDFEIVVVDDGSIDGTAEHVRTAYHRVHVIEGDGSLWWSGAINEGSRYAIARGAEVLVFFNNDNAVLSEGLVSRLAGLAERTGGCVSAVSLAESVSQERQIIHAGGFTDWSHGRHVMVDEGLQYQPADRVESRDWLPGTALAVPRQLFTLLGGIDADCYPQYRGDIDFTLRARAGGYDCLVVRDAWVVNDQGQTGLNFVDRTTPMQILAGLWSYRSSYNLREAVPFALRHCPPLLLPQYLGLYYARYFYACWKTWLPAKTRVKLEAWRAADESSPRLPTGP